MNAEQRAKEALQLLENPRLIEAFDNVRNAIIIQLENTPIGANEARTELVVSLQVLQSIKQDIENDITTAQLDNAG